MFYNHDSGFRKRPFAAAISGAMAAAFASLGASFLLLVSTLPVSF